MGNLNPSPRPYSPHCTCDLCQGCPRYPHFSTLSSEVTTRTRCAGHSLQTRSVGWKVSVLKSQKIKPYNPPCGCRAGLSGSRTCRVCSASRATCSSSSTSSSSCWPSCGRRTPTSPPTSGRRCGPAPCSSRSSASSGSSLSTGADIFYP